MKNILVALIVVMVSFISAFADVIQPQAAVEKDPANKVVQPSMVIENVVRMKFESYPQITFFHEDSKDKVIRPALWRAERTDQITYVKDVEAGKPMRVEIWNHDSIKNVFYKIHIRDYSDIN